MSDTKAAAMNFLNALERIPQIVEQYKAKNETHETNLPVLQEVAGKTWRKKDELKGLKSELADLDRKIQLELAPPTLEVAEKENEGQQVKPMMEDASHICNPENERNFTGDFIADHIVIMQSGLQLKDENRAKGMKL